MSFGTSVGDIILLIQLAHKNYRNCKEAGGEYIEIAREMQTNDRTLREWRANEDTLRKRVRSPHAGTRTSHN